MSRTQLIILWIGIAIFVLMGLFPPDENYNPRYIHSKGRYVFILNVRNIAFSHLFIQWVIVTAITGGLIYNLKVDPELILKIRCRILSWLSAKPAKVPYEKLLKSEREKRKTQQDGEPPESPDK